MSANWAKMRSRSSLSSEQKTRSAAILTGMVNDCRYHVNAVVIVYKAPPTCVLYDTLEADAVVPHVTPPLLPSCRHAV